MINIALVRGAYLNNFEGQNYIFKDDISITGFSSLRAIHRSFPFPVTRLMSPADLPVWQRGMRYLGNRILGDSQMLVGLEQYASQFDIFHTADPHYFYSYQLSRMRESGKIKRLLVTSWETIAHNNETVAAKRKIKNHVLRYADHFLTYAQKAKESLMKEGVGEKKITVIPLGVNLSSFKKKIHNEKKETVYLFAGRLVPEKGAMDVYETYRQMASSGNRLIMIGNGPLRPYLERKIKEDRLSDRVNISEKKYEEMPEMYANADVFILPSKHTATWEEQYGMVLIEAMASGLPVVAYNTGAIGEVVGDAGFLIRENDAKTLIGTMRRLSDWRLRAKVGTMGRDRAVDRYDAKDTARNIAALYKQLTLWK